MLLYKIVNYPNETSSFHDRLCNLIDSSNLEKTRGGGHITSMNFFEDNRDNEDVDTLLTWIKSIVPMTAHNFSKVRYNPTRIKWSEMPLDDEYIRRMKNPEGEDLEYQKHSYGGGGELGFNPHTFKISGCWAVIYNQGDGLVEHNHFPFPLSFCYYLRKPEQSSPLVLGGEEFDLKEGQLIFFEGRENHFVNPSLVNGRYVITGNILYTIE